MYNETILFPHDANLCCCFTRNFPPHLRGWVLNMLRRIHIYVRCYLYVARQQSG